MNRIAISLLLVLLASPTVADTAPDPSQPLMKCSELVRTIEARSVIARSNLLNKNNIESYCARAVAAKKHYLHPAILAKTSSDWKNDVLVARLIAEPTEIGTHADDFEKLLKDTTDPSCRAALENNIGSALLGSAPPLAKLLKPDNREIIDETARLKIIDEAIGHYRNALDDLAAIPPPADKPSGFELDPTAEWASCHSPVSADGIRLNLAYAYLEKHDWDQLDPLLTALRADTRPAMIKKEKLLTFAAGTNALAHNDEKRSAAYFDYLEGELHAGNSEDAPLRRAMLVAEGTAALNKGRFDEALKRYDAAAAVPSDDQLQTYTIVVGRGHAKAGLHDFDGALAEYGRADAIGLAGRKDALALAEAAIYSERAYAQTDVAAARNDATMALSKLKQVEPKELSVASSEASVTSIRLASEVFLAKLEVDGTHVHRDAVSELLRREPRERLYAIAAAFYANQLDQAIAATSTNDSAAPAALLAERGFLEHMRDNRAHPNTPSSAAGKDLAAAVTADADLLNDPYVTGLLAADAPAAADRLRYAEACLKAFELRKPADENDRTIEESARQNRLAAAYEANPARYRDLVAQSASAPAAKVADIILWGDLQLTGQPADATGARKTWERAADNPRVRERLAIVRLLDANEPICRSMVKEAKAGYIDMGQHDVDHSIAMALAENALAFSEWYAARAAGHAPDLDQLRSARQLLVAASQTMAAADNAYLSGDWGDAAKLYAEAHVVEDDTAAGGRLRYAKEASTLPTDDRPTSEQIRVKDVKGIRSLCPDAVAGSQ